MDDLIKRHDAINIVVSALNAEIPFTIVPTLIQGLPSADAVQVPDWLIEWSKDYVREYMRQLKEEIIKRQGDKSD